MINAILNTLEKSLKKVDSSYFELSSSYTSDVIIRERIFCYELYHQIRKIQEENEHSIPYQFHAELDKKGHAYFEKNERKIPDFLIHEAGNDDNNICIIEVKREINNQILKDLNSINIFLEYGYEFGILLVFNHSLDGFDNSILKECNISVNFHDKIFICCIKDNKSKLEWKKMSTILQS